MIPWLLHEDDPVRDWSSWLHPREIEEGARYRHPGRHRQWEHGRVTAKILLGDQAAALGLPPVEPDRLWIRRQPAGWPQVCDGDGRPLPVCLSIAHTAEQALCAVRPAAAGPIGVDLETIAPRPESLLEDFYAPQEHRALMALPRSARDRAATVIWTVKEAVLKAAHTGLADDAKRVAVSSADFPARAGWWDVDVQTADGVQPTVRVRILDGGLVMAIAGMAGGGPPTS